jgi:hypothetical protein
VIQKRKPPATIPGEFLTPEPKPVVDHGAGRRCVECGCKVNRYSEPAFDGPRCSAHWKLDEGQMLVLAPGGGLREVKEPKMSAVPGSLEAARIDAEVELATDAELRLDAPITLADAADVLGLTVDGLRARTVAGRVEAVGADGKRNLYALGALIGVPSFRSYQLPAEPEGDGPFEVVIPPPRAPRVVSETSRRRQRASHARRYAARVEAAGLALDDVITLREAAEVLRVDFRGLQRRRARVGAEPRGRGVVDPRAQLYRVGDLVEDELLGEDVAAA